MELNFLFWNAGRQDLCNDIIDLIQKYNSNFIALAEYTGSPTNLIQKANTRGVNLFEIPKIACESITIFTTLMPNQVEHHGDGDRFTIKEIKIPQKPSLLVGLVHLVSKLHADSITQDYGAKLLKIDIERSEKSLKHMNTIIVGDFNMEPYDLGISSKYSLNSINCSKTALAIKRRTSRGINKETFDFFYNPCWNLFGDFKFPPGTFFHKTPGSNSAYWCLLDQLLMRPSIANWLVQSSLEIPITTGQRSLLNKTGRPIVSDHLPLVFTVRIN